MILTAEPIDAAEALRVGLINTIVPLPALMDAARALAAKLCERGPLALRAAKEAVVRGLSLPLADGLRLEGLLARTLQGTEDAAEGPKAFAEKRAPRFLAR
jgi:enoyl-CoA hydratase/carnithine racemase